VFYVCVCVCVIREQVVRMDNTTTLLMARLEELEGEV